MLAAAFLCCAFALAGILHRQSRFGLRNLIAHTPPSADSDNSKHRVSCEKIAESVSSASRVYYPGEPLSFVWFGLCPFVSPPTLCFYYFLASQEFDSGISHWVNSSSQIPACSVEPGTPRDVALIVNWSFCQYTLAFSLTFATPTTASGDRSSSRAIRYQGWWTYRQPRLFVNSRHTHIYDPIQRYFPS